MKRKFSTWIGGVVVGAALLAGGTGSARADDMAQGKALAPGVVAVPAPSGSGQIICVPAQNQGQFGMNQQQPSSLQQPQAPVEAQPPQLREPVAGRDINTANNAGAAGGECENQVVFFQTGSATLDENAKQLLRDNARCFSSQSGGGGGGSGLAVIGATDKTGSADKNRQLGERRAEAVRQYLTDQGFAAQRIQTGTVGEDRPVCNDSSAECLARNRRVWIHSGAPLPAVESPSPSEDSGTSGTSGSGSSPDTAAPDQSPGQP